jgi:hypothetical protein
VRWRRSRSRNEARSELAEVHHVAGRRDLVPDVRHVVLEGRRAVHQREQARERAANATDRSGRRLDRLEVIGQRDEARGFERPAVHLEQAEDLVEVVRRPQREDGVVGQEADRLRRRGQQLAYDARIGLEDEVPAAPPRRRERKLRSAATIRSNSGPEAACVHGGRRLGEGSPG